MTPLEHAIHYANRGWRVVPIPPGHKHPHGINEWQRVATTDVGRIRRYWERNTDHGIGIATGPASGIFAIDIDPAHDGDDTLRALELAHGPLPDTVMQLTGGGGMHYLFNYPTDGREIRNNQSGRLGVGIDVRGDGGFIVAPPTIHPRTGIAYVWELAHDPFEGQAVADAPDWMLDQLTAEPADLEPRQPARKRLAGDPLPGDWWENKTSWPAELTRRGWTLHSRHHDISGSDYELWTRPGKTVRDGASASLYYKGSDVLKVFSSNAAPLECEQTYTLWGFHVTHEHGGDYEQAARAVRATMPRAPEMPPNRPVVAATGLPCPHCGSTATEAVA